MTSPTPWTKEECRDRYVRGSQISLRQLASDSGNSRKTLEDWSRFDVPKWSEQRREFQGEARVRGDHKAIENISDRTSNLTVQHLDSYQSARRVVDTYFAFLNRRIDEVKDIPERLEAELKSIRASNINFMMLSLERAINGERTAAGLEWENVPKAIAFLQRQGYQIVDPTIDREVGLEELGLSDEAAELIKMKLLGVEDSGTDTHAPTFPTATTQAETQTH
jgi:hypothetical protein